MENYSKSKPILVVQTAFVGDVILSIPMLKAIRKNFPGHPIWMVVRSPLNEFVVESGLVDRAFGVNKKDNKQFRQVSGELSQFEYFKIFCPHQSLRSALLVHKLKAEKKVGYKTWWNFWVFDERMARAMQLPEALRSLQLVTSQQFHGSEWQWLGDDLKRMATQIDTAKVLTREVPEHLSNSIPKFVGQPLEQILPISLFDIIDRTKRYIAIAPGSVWPTKRWTEIGYVELATQLCKKGFTIFWVGSGEENQLCQRLSAQTQKRLRETSNSRTTIQHNFVVAGLLPLHKTAQLFAHMKCVIANDSGAMHLATTVNVPIVSIFGPTILRQGYFPWSSKARVAQVTLPCRPCGKHGHNTCPLKTHECMKSIPADRVSGLVTKLLGPY